VGSLSQELVRCWWVGVQGIYGPNTIHDDGEGELLLPGSVRIVQLLADCGGANPPSPRVWSIVTVEAGSSLALTSEEENLCLRKVAWQGLPSISCRK
jgi:hypothetical protein